MWTLLIVTGLALADPLPPQWPNTFTQSFNETFISTSYGNHTTNGVYYYDYTSQSTRIDRDNGRYDAFCGLNGFKILVDGPCNQFAVGGNRYIHYPKDHYCCFCCNYQQGCGPLYPTWMDNSTFLGTTMHNGVQAYAWDKMGNQPNYYYETVATQPSQRVMLGIYEMPDDFKDFHSISYSVPAGTFDLPKECSVKIVCPETSVCTQIRGSGLQSVLKNII
ncbi:unnamed protein product [Blepharisma stoltei]|uniref:Uncharacterized protein n=1 Tax=Blepharisma stoltei TaxID=1481888 RepID=A0AAU9J908_9CILI|nr:unnamed protein product [Blepharisma stoltei]